MKSRLKILVVSWSFPPDKNPKAVKTEAIVDELVRRGHSVTLLTKGNFSDFPRTYFNRIDRLVLMDSKEWKKLNVNLEKSEKWSLAKIKRLINGAALKFFSYPQIQAFFAVFKELKVLKNEFYDLCLSVDGPQQMHWGIALARKIERLKVSFWIADCGDPLTRHTVGNSVAPYFKLSENFFCTVADKITVPVKQGFNYFPKRFNHKIHLVEHSLIFPKDLQISKSNNKKNSGVKSFAFGGNIMPYREEAKSFFNSLNDIGASFEFHIYGGNEDFIQELLSLSLNIKNNVFIHGKMDRFELLENLMKHDFLVYFPYPNGSLQVPFKLIDYSFTGLPILEFKYKEKDLNKLKAFIEGDFKESRKVLSYKNFSNRKTVQKYLELLP